MNFKKVEMVGFKSFADLVKINFDSGITAIVGPNGCGKSNVADAIRWVLGEQSSKMLRGTNMQDVIFKGTEKRKSLSFCEVSLHFDNSNKVFRSDYDDIVITRKLYRSGDSEYLINSTPSRLKDIIDMLHDSGIGKSGYSIIGQGKVDEILNSKPKDRRAIFEEAAGIAKFKFKKVESERKLERTQDNLTRLNDIITEIDRQLTPLKRQSEVAKKYLELKERLKLLEVNAYIYQHDYASNNRMEIQTKIDAIVEELELRQTKLNNAVLQYNNTFDSINNIDNEITVLNNTVLNLTVDLEKQAGQANLIREKINNAELEDMRLSGEIKKLLNNTQEFKDQLNNKNSDKNAKLQKMESLNIDLSEIEEKYVAIASELQLSEKESQEAQQVIFDTLNKIGDVKAQVSALEAEKATYSENLKNQNISKIELSRKLTEANENKNKLNTNVISMQEKHQGIERQLNELVTNSENVQSNLKIADNEVTSINSSIISLSGRKKILEDMQREFEGYQGSVKRLLQDADKNVELKKLIVGVVANLIKVPSKYDTAIEMALGSAVQNIVTNNDEDAKKLVAYLKNRQYGRATFLPITAIKPRYFDMKYKNAISVSGSFGVADKLVEFDDKISNIVSSLLGGTVIVEDINIAVAIAKNTNYGFRIVTLDGDIINPQGSITGGSKKAQVANLLSRESEIESIEANLRKLNSELKIKQEQQAKLYESNNVLVAQIKDLSARVHNAEIEMVAENEKANRYSQAVLDIEVEANKLESDIAKTEQIISAIKDKLATLSSDTTSYDSTSNDMSTQFSKFDELRSKRDKYNEMLTNAKVEYASLNTEILALTNEVERIKFAIISNNNIAKEYEDALFKNRELLSSYKGMVSVEVENKDTADNINKLNESKKKLADINEIKHQLQATLRSIEAERQELTAEVGRLNDRKFQQELNLSKIDTDLETLQEKVYTDYELTYETSQDYKLEEFDVKQGLIDINKLRREINSLGNVNVNAIEDFKLLSERHGNLYGEAQDLIKAESDLKQIIKELSIEMIARFEEEFNKINANFSVVFKELFGGGSARLELVESDDVLEAGVDIIAEPPGKKLSNIALLSGGEKALTAIAILFAILRLRPMPFCLLDEIEAPLDEANVARFANYLKRYSGGTQFIVITHKKTTMEFADALYGVTMEEKGVSKIVSVKLGEAVNTIEGETK